MDGENVDKDGGWFIAEVWKILRFSKELISFF